MLSIEIIDEDLILKNINKDSIQNIYSIFKNSCDFKYATGVFHPMGYQLFSKQISQFITRKNVFYLDICSASTGEKVGLVKGLVVDKNKIAWINSLIIGKPYQNKGFGTKAIWLLEDFLVRNFNIDKIYLSVYKTNTVGINFWTKCGYSEYDYPSHRSSEAYNELVKFMGKIL